MVALLIATLATPALACPIELSTYADRDGVAELEFQPRGDATAVTNSFRMLMAKDVVFDGVVMWSEGVARPNGIVMRECPEGDVTGEEIAACTLWQGVIYSADETGAIGLLPAEGEPPPKRLILADLAYTMSQAPAWNSAGLETLPWDVFELKGCQE